MDALVKLDISPQVGGLLLSISAGLAAIWLLACCYLALLDLRILSEQLLQGRIRFPQREFLPYVRTNNISGFLGVASALTFTAANFPQPQTLSSFLVVVLAICSGLGWLDIEDAGELAPKGFDVLTVIITAVLVMDKANTYQYRWLWYHDPNLYCLMALSLEGACAIIGLWGWVAGDKGRQVGARRHAMAGTSQALPARLILILVISISLTSFALCIVAMIGDIEPYLVGFGLICTSFLFALVLSITILAQSYKRFTGIIYGIELRDWRIQED